MLVIGAGGHAKVVIDVARAAGWNPTAILDPVGPGHMCSDVPVVGGDDEAGAVYAGGIRHAVVAIGLNKLRARIGERLLEIGFTCPTILHPSSIISPYARIGEGTVVMPGAIINAWANVGRFVILNTGAIIEHDCRIGDGAHIAPRSVMGGNVKVGAQALFGIGSVARPETTIGQGAIVGAGSVVVSAIEEFVTVMGAPATQRKGRMD
ncbi:acetyltransferase [Sphingobium algorifonticola]|uniref:Acetyltransferase n=2 Tax=Sphingobium algorifonticola TaxID=2008318 RepID=A0A437J577_9SPHN|nr:acetyltransferase [Sphingobium algorifonticola]